MKYLKVILKSKQNMWYNDEYLQYAIKVEKGDLIIKAYDSLRRKSYNLKYVNEDAYLVYKDLKDMKDINYIPRFYSEENFKLFYDVLNIENNELK